MATRFHEIINLCKLRGFLKIDNNDIILNSIGYLLHENLKTEWLHSNLINRDINSFLSDTKIDDSFNFAKDLSDERLPFGITQISNNDVNFNKTNELDVLFHPNNQLKLQTYTFVSPAVSTQYFYNWQRQRRMWWRKFSASPGRYALADIQTSKSGAQNVEISATYEWGSHIMETINLIPNPSQFLTNDQLHTRDARKRVQAHCIKSISYLTTMVLNTLCDAYDDPLFQTQKRPFLRFHRKLAPYKISFVTLATKSGNVEELNDLATYLCKKLRANQISVLLLANISRNSMEAQCSHYDQLGIPYCVILNDSTLKNGIAHLRSRDTTLKEQVHISDLPSYIDKLYRNY